MWQPAQIESLRQKLHVSLNVSLEPRALKIDSPVKQRIHKALVKVSAILAQAGLNIMRHRNTQTKDAANPLNIPQAGKKVPRPLDLLNLHKSRRQVKGNSKLPVEPPKNTRVVIASPPFKPHRLTPKERARMDNAAVKQAIEYDVSVQAITNAEMHEALYAGPFICLVETAPVA